MSLKPFLSGGDIHYFLHWKLIKFNLILMEGQNIEPVIIFVLFEVFLPERSRSFTLFEGIYRSNAAFVSLEESQG